MWLLSPALLVTQASLDYESKSSQLDVKPLVWLDLKEPWLFYFWAISGAGASESIT